jgi:hypothetical protein
LKRPDFIVSVGATASPLADPSHDRLKPLRAPPAVRKGFGAQQQQQRGARPRVTDSGFVTASGMTVVGARR